MDTERSVVPAALSAACPAVREADPASDAVAGLVPSFVASPVSTEEAAALLRTAAGYGLTVVPRGAGTGLGWGAPPSACDLVVDMRRMDQVIEHAAGDLVARVQAGATMGYLASVLASAGQQLALDAPADATVGGVVATGTAGPRRFRYGAPRDLLIGITVVRADGVIAHSGGKVVKNVAGYDLGKLFAGSAGTLGLITDATFRLHPLPGARAFVVAEYGSVAAACDAVAAAANSQLVASAVELSRSSPGSPVRIGVLLEGSADGAAARASRMADLLSPATPGSAEVSASAPPWWPGPPEASDGPLIRVSFWVSALDGVLDAIDEAARGTGISPQLAGSAGAGVLYVSCPPTGAAAAFVAALREALEHGRGKVVVLAAPAPVRDALAAGGMAGTHQPALSLMRAVKDQFDPGHRMAPGRFPEGI